MSGWQGAQGDRELRETRSSGRQDDLKNTDRDGDGDREETDMKQRRRYGRDGNETKTELGKRHILDNKEYEEKTKAKTEIGK